MYLTEHDPNDINVFYRRYTDFYAKHKVMLINSNTQTPFVVVVAENLYMNENVCVCV